MTQQRQTQPHSDVTNKLLSMLEYRRPAGSRSERKFIARFLLPLGAKCDQRGNFYLRVGTAPVMWSCHTDSVHTMGGMQNLIRVGEFGIGVSKKDKSNCLGADDAAGIFLMHEMICAGKEGLYIFHREEEHGCVGSRWLVKNNPALVDGIRFAIALDRRNKDDIITHQSGRRCCSDDFANSLAEQLDMGYKPSSFGSYTDTAQYTDLIGECTNISVGYTGAHTSSEVLDGAFILQLRDKLLHLDVNKLVEKRKAGEVEEKTHHYYYPGAYGSDYSDDYARQYSLDHEGGWFPRAGAHGYWDMNGDYHAYWDDKGVHKPFPMNVAVKDYEERRERQKWWQRLFEKSKKETKVIRGTAWHKPKETVRVVSPSRSVPAVRDTTPSEDQDFFERRVRNPTLEQLCKNHPDEVADFLEQVGYTADDIMRHVLETTGMLRLRGH